MKTTLGKLREHIRLMLEFGVDDDNRYSAGFFMAGGVNGNHRDRETSMMSPPPGLGGPEEDEDNEQETEMGQPGARVYNRRGGDTRRQARIRRTR